MTAVRRRKMMKLDEAARRFPVGSAVRFYPVEGLPDFEDADVRSEPWALGHGQVVVAITGRAGGVAVEHLRSR